MIQKIQYARTTGVLIILAIVAGVLSVSPAVDSSEYLSQAAGQKNQIMFAALAQFAMSLFYIAAAILLYAFIKPINNIAALSFLTLKAIAAVLVIISTVLLISIYVVSAEFALHQPVDSAPFVAMGEMLKITRDQLNHVFMIFILCGANIALFGALLKAKLIPTSISTLGILGAALSIVASILVLFDVYDIISTAYLTMNAPTALADIALSVWLIAKGFTQHQ